MTVTELVPQQSTVLVDARDTGLRATWHPGERVVVLSHWHDGVCASTFRLAGPDVTRLTTFLVGVLGDQAQAQTTSATVAVRPSLRAWFDGIRARLTRA